MDPQSVTQEELVRQWAEIVVDRWRAKLRKLKVGVTDELYNSMLMQLSRISTGEVERVDFSFLQYGRFRDMGVGKGQPIAMVKENARPLNRLRGNKPRRPAKWYSKTLAAETKTLAELLANHYQLKALDAVFQLSERIQIEL